MTEKEKPIVFSEWMEAKKKTIQIENLSFKNKIKLCIGVLLESKIVFNSAPNKIKYSVEYVQEKEQ